MVTPMVISEATGLRHYVYPETIRHEPPPAAPVPQHDFSIVRGMASFCSRCGDLRDPLESGKCSGHAANIMENIETRISAFTRYWDASGVIRADFDKFHAAHAARAASPAWSNISAAINAKVGGWNRRP